MKLISWCSTAVALLIAVTRAADLGDPAADLKIAKWVKGDAVQLSSDPKNIYVVEFWATWCPPCRTSIPHLTDIQKRFKDKNVTIVGITDEKESTVAPFVKKMADKMDYRVAIDDDGETAKGYMQAFGIGGIPHAFIVQEKKVIWQGHPMAGLDETLEQIVSGKYNISKAKAKQKTEALMAEFQQAVAEDESDKADRLAREIQAVLKESGDSAATFDPAAEKKRIRGMVLKNNYRNAVFRGMDDEAEKLGKELSEVDPTADLKALRKEALLRKDVMAYFRAISGESKSGDYKTMGPELAEKVKGEPELGNNIAWSILTEESVKHRDLPVALKISKQAAEDTQWKQPHIIDTYARALFDSGKKEEAVEAQEKALRAADDSDKAMYERTLKAYKEGKLPTTEE